MTKKITIKILTIISVLFMTLGIIFLMPSPVSTFADTSGTYNDSSTKALYTNLVETSTAVEESDINYVYENKYGTFTPGATIHKNAG